jgi:hypothetical protein
VILTFDALNVYTGRVKPKSPVHPIPRVNELINKYTDDTLKAEAIKEDNAVQLATLSKRKPTWIDHITPISHVIEAVKFITREDCDLVYHVRSTITLRPVNCVTPLK